ncbi:MAG: anti-sigma factor family protein [Gemmatimonadaceae bacterium]
MDCRQFREKHVPFIDDVLSAVEMRAMYQHRAVCPRCSRHDTAIRRSLLLVRNLPSIQPSPDFVARLNARLEEIRPESRIDVIAPRPQFQSAATFAALAAGVAVVAYMALETSHYFARPMAAPAVAVAAPAPLPLMEPGPAPIANAAFVASVPTGIPLWPAVIMAGQAPMHFASTDFHDVEFAR